ncbi:hypothetical protein [Mycoplasmopsis cynos]|uniref:hypothetical protein n=1 Tax=Mycoplasmopsis cynos TaxID=171284 RepID=UPI00220B6B59|nr:hypothetical protein [Mycoplasmopsis cynos]UWV77003.1 hypothetical protein NW070_04305 [Mycoplasmopsis cynos]
MSLNNIDELKGTSGDQYNKPWLISKDLLKPNAFTDGVLNEVKESQTFYMLENLKNIYLALTEIIQLKKMILLIKLLFY